MLWTLGMALPLLEPQFPLLYHKTLPSVGFGKCISQPQLIIRGPSEGILLSRKSHSQLHRPEAHTLSPLEASRSYELQ